MAARFSAAPLRPGQTPVAGAPWVVFAHGFAGHQAGEKAEAFRAGAAARGYSFAAFDFRGHGESSGDLRSLTLDRNLEDLRVFFDELGKRGGVPPFVVGSSMGALSVMWYSALHPGALAAAVQVAPALTMGEDFERFAGPEGLERWQREGVLRFRNDHVDTELGFEFVDSFRRYPVARLAELYRAPTLLLLGRRDELVSWRRVLEFVAAHPGPGLDLHLFGDGDHRMTDRKQLLVSLALDFFERQRPLGRS